MDARRGVPGTARQRAICVREPRKLALACDQVLCIGEGDVEGVDRPMARCPVDIGPVRTPDGERMALASLGTLDVGLVLAIARPNRVVDALAKAGVHPRATILEPDHGRFDLGRLARVARERGLVAWLTTGKCATKLDRCPVPVWVLEHRVDISAINPALTRALEPW